MPRRTGSRSRPFAAGHRPQWLRIVSGVLLVVAGAAALLPAAAQSPKPGPTRPAVPAARVPAVAAKTVVTPQLSLADRNSVAAVYQTMHRLVPISLDLSNPAHRAFFIAHRRAAGITPESDKTFASFLSQADAYYAKRGKPKSGFVFMVKGKVVDEVGAPTSGPVGPVLTVTSFQQITSRPGTYGVSGLVSLPGQPQVCTQTLQVFDDAGNPQGPADINTQNQACENSQLYAEGQLPQAARYASAHLVAHGVSNNGTPFAYALVAEGSSIPTSIVSTNPNDLTGDGMIKFCFGRTSPDCDYSPAGSSQNNVLLPINGNTTWSSALTSPGTDANASVSIAITQPQPQAGGGCNLVANVPQFLQQNVTLSNNNLTVNWNDQAVQFPPINSVCMPNGSIVYYNMSMDVDLASGVPTFFGISSSPDTPISTGFYLMLVPTRIYYSCLAADSQVELADGTFKAIADIRTGEAVASGPQRKPLKVAFIYTGTEEQPLVSFRTQNGFALKVTQGHPVITEQGVRLARFLKVGDVLVTAQGHSPITALERVAYSGKVYNLSLISPEPNVKIADEEQLFYGGGILVGGNEVQWRYDRADAQANAVPLAPPVVHMSDAARRLLAKRFGAPMGEHSP
jgi:hypothetical protein